MIFRLIETADLVLLGHPKGQIDLTFFCRGMPPAAKIFMVSDNDDRVAGYFNLTVSQVDVLYVPERVRKGIGQYPVPVVVLARLAVSAKDHGREIGIGMLQDEIRRTLLISEQAGIRAMLTPLRERQLLLLLKDVRRWMT